MLLSWMLATGEVAETAGLVSLAANIPLQQVTIPKIEQLPNIPQPFLMRDWKRVALDYDALVFDHKTAGRFMPLIWIDKTHTTFDRDGFGLYTVMGDTRMGPTNNPGSHESINCMAAVIGASLAGVDKRSQDGFDYVAMCKDYFSPREVGGPGIFLDVITPPKQSMVLGSMFYFLLPNILASWLEDCYPGHAGLDALVRQSADNLLNMVPALIGGKWYTGFDFAKNEPVFNNLFWEGDAVGGLACIEYMAWARFGSAKYLDAARLCMNTLETNNYNPFYEVLLPFNATLAARMNAEAGTHYDVERILNWFANADSACRGRYIEESKKILSSPVAPYVDGKSRRTWGLITGRWGRYDVGGLVGSPEDGGGYAFAMNTFDAIAALAPLPRYDGSFARIIGKYVLNAANASRLFYANGLPPENQTCYDQRDLTRDAIAYEGVRNEGVRPGDRDKKPCACGDPTAGHWGMVLPSDFSLYGSSHVGFLGAVVSPTSDEKILQINCLTTDFHHAKAYPTYLYYNPYDQSKTITINLGAGTYDLYDTVSHEFVSRKATGQTGLELPADFARVIIVIPSGKKRSVENGHLMVDEIAVDYYGNYRAPHFHEGQS